MQDNKKTGGISVETQHIFPIIKKWLYSESEIFLREIISNAADAITKLKRLSSLGEVKDIADSFRIDVSLDADARTITVSDNGIGMTEEELLKYIGQIALSGATEFIEKYEGKDGGADGIIGHFGLGFYSAFMVSDSVEVITRSYKGEAAVHWVCNDGGSYELSAGERGERGTDIIMHINEDGAEFLDAGRLRSVLDKYCAFMPVPIFFDDGTEHKDSESTHKEGTHKECTHKECTHKECGDEKCGDEECCHDHGEKHGPKQINETNPLWMRPASECTKEDYNEFYHKVFGDWREPLISVHLNADYPLNFKGILYFPKISHEYESLEGQVKLYYNQVFVADNIKEVIPEYLLMLRGVLDCPELPLNVSRSYLQNNGYVAKISAHIVKKVADKINSIFNTDRAAFEALWQDIKTFFEYACLNDRKFFDRVKDVYLFRLTDGSYATVSEYLEKAKEKNDNRIYYTTDKQAQAQYVSLLTGQGIAVAELERVIDTQFITLLEQSNKDLKILRVDADLAQALKGEGKGKESKRLTKLFREVSGNKELRVSFEKLKDAALPAILTVSEESRRINDMMKMYNLQNGVDKDMYKLDYTLVLNSENAVVQKLSKMKASSTDALIIAGQIFSLATLSQRQFSAEELNRFLSGSYSLLEKLCPSMEEDAENENEEEKDETAAPGQDGPDKK